MEIDLANTAYPTTPGTVDAYLTVTSCTKLFEGPYPGSQPLCKVLVGPAPSGKVSPRAPLDAGTYRVWAYGYSSNPGGVSFLIDVTSGTTAASLRCSSDVACVSGGDKFDSCGGRKSDSRQHGLAAG